MTDTTQATYVAPPATNYGVPTFWREITDQRRLVELVASHVIQHLMSQGEPAEESGLGCRYRLAKPDGRVLACGIGCMISDAAYARFAPTAEQIESWDMDDEPNGPQCLLENKLANSEPVETALRDSGVNIDDGRHGAPLRDFLTRVQNIHDSISDVTRWPGMIEIAKQYALGRYDGWQEAEQAREHA